MAVGSDWLRNEAAKYFFLTDSMGTRPSSWELALILDDGNEVSSSEDSNYVRQSVSFVDTGDVGRVENDAAVSFPAAGGSYTIAEFAVYDGNGNLLVQEALEFQKSIETDDVVSFAAGDLVAGVGV